MNLELDWIQANTDQHFADAAQLMRAYARELPIKLDFQGFDEELTKLGDMYVPPEGGLWVVYQERTAVACVGIRLFDAGIAELKRMYIQPAFRGKGLGKRLVDKALELALELGYQQVLLDTLDTMTPAIRCYEAAGFQRIDAYYFNPEPNVLYFAWTNSNPTK